MQRLARVPIDQKNEAMINLLQHYDEIVTIIRHYLPPSTANMIACPKIINEENTNIVEWYSSLQGQAILLTVNFPNEELVNNINSLIKKRLIALNQLSESTTISKRQANLLKLVIDAINNPKRQIYLINNEPVITGWNLTEKSNSTSLPISSNTSKKQSTQTIIKRKKNKQRSNHLILPIVRKHFCCLFLLFLIIFGGIYSYLNPNNLMVINSKNIITFATNKIEQWTTSCPSKMAPEDRPKMIIIFDDSGSMSDLVSNEMTYQKFAFYIFNLMSNDYIKDFKKLLAPSRLNIAKQSSLTLINSIRTGVDIGLITISNVKDYGFFQTNQRSELSEIINKMRNVGGTNLYEGLLKAIDKLNGIDNDAFILIVSDGEDSSISDNQACEMITNIAKQKPRLRISTVDVGGNQVPSCVPEITKGQQIKGNSSTELVSLIRETIKPLIKTEDCQ